jgi:hypothetical protein
MERMTLKALSAAVAIGSFALPACAGEADHEPDDTHEHGAAYFGEAKDIGRMEPLANVRIKGQIRGTTRFFIIQTDEDGRFRRAGIGLDVDAETVEITCEKSGFRAIDVLRRRASAAKDAAVEVECLMEKVK